MFFANEPRKPQMAQSDTDAENYRTKPTRESGRSADTFVRENWREKPMGEDYAHVNEWGGVSLAVGSGYQRNIPSHGHADKGVCAPIKDIYQTNPSLWI
jgi:hypothetical protein